MAYRTVLIAAATIFLLAIADSRGQYLGKYNPFKRILRNKSTCELVEGRRLPDDRLLYSNITFVSRKSSKVVTYILTFDTSTITLPLYNDNHLNRPHPHSNHSHTPHPHPTRPHPHPTRPHPHPTRPHPPPPPPPTPYINHTHHTPSNHSYPPHPHPTHPHPPTPTPYFNHTHYTPSNHSHPSHPPTPTPYFNHTQHTPSNHSHPPHPHPTHPHPPTPTPYFNHTHYTHSNHSHPPTPHPTHPFPPRNTTKISFISVHNLLPNRSCGKVTIIEGGIGYPNVTIKITSRRGKAILYQIELYGK